jgi:hypothetical protein
MGKIRDEWNREYPSSGGSADPQAQERLNEELASAVAQMDYESATACKVYLEPGAIRQPTVYGRFKGATTSLPPSDIWTAQLWLWNIQDAVTAVARANADGKDVTDSPVKQITDLTVKDPPYLIVGDPTVGDDKSPLTPAPDASPTGRVSNGMYDVTQFSMGLDVDADRLPQVLNGLQTGQFLTILSAQVTAIDSADRAKSGFLYGKARIVHLDLVFEDLFLHTTKGGYSQLCPPNCGPQAGGANGSGGGGGGANSGNLLTITTHGG